MAGGGCAGHWDHANALASIVGDEEGARALTISGWGRRTNRIASRRGLSSGGADATQQQRETSDNCGTGRTGLWKHDNARAAPEGDEEAM